MIYPRIVSGGFFFTCGDIGDSALDITLQKKAVLNALSIGPHKGLQANQS